MIMKYFPINEDAARRAKEANSFSDYVPGSATASYKTMVDRAEAIAQRQKGRVDPEYHDRIDGLLTKYARELAKVINEGNEIDARVPSVMIAGPANFPVRKKEKQNAARDRNNARYTEVQGILDRIESVGMGGIRSDDANALEKLKVKLVTLEKHQATMKAANAAVRMKDTAAGDAKLAEMGFSSEEIRQLRIPDCMGRAGYHAYELSNNNANIRRIKERIATLEKEALRAAENAGKGPVEGEGYRLVENAEIGRIQFFFDAKPDAETRDVLKDRGFRWAPSQGAWQRMLNESGRYAAKVVREYLEQRETLPRF